MAADHASPEVLITLPSEIEAAEIVNALADHGIHATATGNYTSGFRAEAPGEISVVVRRVDLTQAETVLRVIRSERPVIDWSTVDFENGQSASDQEDERLVAEPKTASAYTRTASQQKHAWCQFRIRTLLGLQTILCLALGVWKGPYTALMSAIFLIGATFALTVSGAVAIASDLTRARQAWMYVGRALTVGLVLLALFLLTLAVGQIVEMTF